MKRTHVKNPFPFRLRFVVTPLVAFAALLLSGCLLLTQPVRVGAREGPPASADAKRLETDVFAIAHPRPWDDLEALNRTAGYIEEQLRAQGYTPTEQPYDVEGRAYKNVRLIIGDPAAPRLVVGAHYDSCEAYPAADDNGSGVAVVLELARLLKAKPPPGAVELVFWSLEEPPYFRSPHMGSAVHAAALKKEGTRVIAALSIETVGYYRDEPGTQHFPVDALGALYSTTGNYVALVSNLDNVSLVRQVKSAMLSVKRISVRSINAPVVIPGIDWSDHRSYWAQGMPALMVTDTAPNRNPAYHEPSDTPDTLDYKRMAAVTEALFEAVWQLVRGS